MQWNEKGIDKQSIIIALMFFSFAVGGCWPSCAMWSNMYKHDKLQYNTMLYETYVMTWTQQACSAFLFVFSSLSCLFNFYIHCFKSIKFCCFFGWNRKKKKKKKQGNHHDFQFSLFTISIWHIYMYTEWRKAIGRKIQAADHPPFKLMEIQLKRSSKAHAASASLSLSLSWLLIKYIWQHIGPYYIYIYMYVRGLLEHTHKYIASPATDHRGTSSCICIYKTLEKRVFLLKERERDSWTLSWGNEKFSSHPD